jgi:predicted ATPase
MTPTSHPPRIERLHVKNYRALRDIKLEKMTPLTVLLGPNGSGKSTVFDVFAFLAECFTDGLRKAWDRRGRFRELRSRDQGGPIVIEIQYREMPHNPLITYHLEIEEQVTGPVVARESTINTARARSSRERPRNQPTLASKSRSPASMCWRSARWARWRRTPA